MEASREILHSSHQVSSCLEWPWGTARKSPSQEAIMWPKDMVLGRDPKKQYHGQFKLLSFHSDCSHKWSLPRERWLLQKQHYLKGLPPPRPFMPETASSLLQWSRLEPEFLSPCNMSSARTPVQWLGNNVCDNHLATSRFSKKKICFSI